VSDTYSYQQMIDDARTAEKAFNASVGFTNDIHAMLAGLATQRAALGSDPVGEAAQAKAAQINGDVQHWKTMFGIWSQVLESTRNRAAFAEQQRANGAPTA
jgi:hypothetical protein